MADKPSKKWNKWNTQEELDKEIEDFLARLTPKQRKLIEGMQPGARTPNDPIDIEELLRRIESLGKKKS